MRVQVDNAGNVTAWSDALAVDAINIDAGYPEQPPNPAGAGWKVVGDPPNRVLVTPNGSKWGRELIDASRSVTLTTGPDTFEVDHYIDLGRPTVVTATATVLSDDGDGETFAAEDGGVALFVDYFASAAGYLFGAPISPRYKAGAPVSKITAPEGHLVGAGTRAVTAFACARYLRIYGMLYDWTSEEQYAGANHPQARFRVDLDTGGT